jgi:hypothetical protein
MTRIANEGIAAAGLTANRTNSVFVYPTNGKGNAAGYDGFIHIAVPSNGFKFTWAPGIVDLYGDIIEEYRESEWADRIRRIKWLGDDNTLSQALHSDCEIMLSCDQVALFEPAFWERYILPELRARE